jgi:long-chain acyl-CoA synthetase
MNTLIDLVTEGARRFDDRPALLIRPGFRTRIWRFRDLGRVVPRAARVLREAGLGPGDRVIIWAVNRPEWAVAFLAVAHAGGVTVPLDVRHAQDFAAKVATRTGARMVLASRQTADSARSLGLPIVWIEALPDLARRVEPLPPAAIGPDDLAEIVFTSGTTGDPKGAMISHGNLLASATGMSRVFPIGPNERLVSVLPLSHLFEQGIGLIIPLLVGASVVYPASRQPAVLLRTFRDHRATMLLIVPQGLRLLDNAIGRKVDQSGRRDLFERLHRLARHLPRPLRRLLFRPVLSQLGGKLHTIGVGASALDATLAARWMEMGVDVLQGYGATEMSPAISFTRPARNRVGTVGEAIPGVEIRVQPDGELFVRGPNRFQGYWQDPVATAAAIDSDGWYHTGDLGVLAPDGVLTLRGRKKDMLALPDGQKVYPDDVEAVLDDDPRLRGVAVVGWPLGADLKVHAVLLLDDPGQAEAVVRDANARLGAHQQIRGWTIWPDDDLPRTAALKVKKHIVLERLAEMAARPAAAAAEPASVAASGAAPAKADDGVDPVTALVAQMAGLAALGGGPDRPSIERSQPRLPPARRVAGCHRGGVGHVHRRRRARTGGDRRGPGGHGGGRPRRQAGHGHLRLAPEPDRPSRRYRASGPAHLALRASLLPRAPARARASRGPGGARAVHAQPLPAHRQRHHPHPPALSLALAHLHRGRRGRHLRQPRAGVHGLADGQCLPAGARGRGAP